MGVVPTFTKPTEKYVMKLQQLIFKVEELKALVSLFEQMQQGYAQATMLRETMEGSSEEERAAVDEKLDDLKRRFEKVQLLLMEKTGGASEDDAVEKVQEHIARLQQFQQVRGEQLQLRTQLDLELAMGDVPLETRQQVENTLQSMQARLETLVRLGEQAFPGTRLITLG
jgi:hypothetical protein